MSPSQIILFGIAAAALSLVTTPLVCRLAQRWKFIDRPDRARKLQSQPVPLGGGISVWLSLWMAIGLAAISSSAAREALADKAESLLGFFVGTALIVVLGLVDDYIGLRGRHKLMGQIVIAGVMMSFGCVINGFKLFGLEFELGLLSLPISILWFLLAINSLNLIDGVDGLASTIGIVLSLALALIAGLNGHAVEAGLLAALAGALLGFLRSNFPPARIYLGDAGSMLIGLSLGALSIQGAMKGPAVVGLAAPFAVWTVPLFDTFAAIVRRNLTGRSIYTPDRGHLQHCLQQIAGSKRRTLYLVVLACAATCMGALASVSFKSDIFALISAVSVIGVLIATRTFGFGELQLLTARLRNLMQYLLIFRSEQSECPQQCVVRFQGSRPWEQLWSSLMEFTDEFNLMRMCLDVNVPSIQEDYHVSWKKPCPDDQRLQWSVEFPLCAGDRPVGRLEVYGQYDGFSACTAMAKFLDVLQSFETRFQTTIDELEANVRTDGRARVGLGSDEIAVDIAASNLPRPRAVPGVLVNGK